VVVSLKIILLLLYLVGWRRRGGIMEMKIRFDKTRLLFYRMDPNKRSENRKHNKIGGTI
jgi:hypothetical protein